MNIETGEIKRLEDLTDEEKKSNKWIELTTPESKNIYSMNRAERRKCFLRNKKIFENYF
jgi:hypothetical protein